MSQPSLRRNTFLPESFQVLYLSVRNVAVLLRKKKEKEVHLIVFFGNLVALSPKSLSLSLCITCYYPILQMRKVRVKDVWEVTLAGKILSQLFLI